ncbi:MAG: DpnD/PcfM family protein [Prevotella sp.]|nr:DpnD/PcfM family protein [Prevotella sp.]
MTKYRIEVTEVLSRIVETDAENEDDAVEMVRQMYRNCELVLDASDYVETEISVKSEKAGRNACFVERNA